MTQERGPERDLAIYSILRAYARDEGEHINKRLNWLGVSQSVLLTAYAALLSIVGAGNVAKLMQGLSVRAGALQIEGQVVLTVVFSAIAATGGLLCLLTFFNLAGAFQSEDTIKVRWNEYLRKSADPELRDHLPFMAFGFDPKGGRAAPIWRVGVVILPITFLALWALLGGFAVLLVRGAAPA